MNAQRLRNITAGRLHTEIAHVYEDLEWITGEKGLMTHMLPAALYAVRPWLEDHVTEKRFWDGECDTTHAGEYDLPEPTKEDRVAMLKRFKAYIEPAADAVAQTTPTGELAIRDDDLLAAGMRNEGGNRWVRESDDYLGHTRHASLLLDDGKWWCNGLGIAGPVTPEDLLMLVGVVFRERQGQHQA